MSKRERDEFYDKDEIRNRRNSQAEHKEKRQKGNKGKTFNRQRARQKDSEASRSEGYFY